MNALLVASAVLVAGLGVFHSVLGERYIVRRLLRRDNLPKLWGEDSFTKVTIRFAWHITSLLALGVAALLWHLAEGSRLDETGRFAGRLVGVTLAACGMLGLVVTRGRHLAWIVFLAAAALAWLGTMAA